MATRLLQIVTFTNVAPAATVALPHTLNIAGTPVTPDYVVGDVGDFSISATSATVTVTNNGADPTTINVWLERKHSATRELGGGITNLTPQPFVAGGGGSGGGGGEITVLTFRPGSGATGPFVFDDWTVLYAALQAIRVTQLGPITVVIDEAASSPIIPVGGYDLAGVTLAGTRGFNNLAPVSLLLDDGVSITGLAGISGLAVTRAGVSAPPINMTGIGPALFIEGATLLGGGAGSEMIAVSGNGNVIRLGDSGGLLTSSVLLATGADVTVFLDGAGSGVGVDAATGDVTTGFVTYIGASSAGLGPQPNALGIVRSTMLVPQWYWDLGDPNGIVSAVSKGFSILDMTTAGHWVATVTGGTAWTFVP